MCGLVALYAKRSTGFYSPDADIFNQMLYADAVRGWDSTGVFGVTKTGNVHIKKQAIAAGPFIVNPAYKEFENKILPSFKILVGHNRKATHGSKIDENAHPFWSKNEKIVLVHNGVITNHKELHTEAVVDSDAICQALSTTDDVLKTLSQLTGSYALIWFNTEEKKMYFVRNDSRPLHLIETEHLCVLASEDKMAHWILGRNNQTIKTTLTVKAGTLYSILLDGTKVEVVGEVPKKATFFSQQHKTTTYYPSTAVPTTSTTIGKAKSLIGKLLSIDEPLPQSCFYTIKDVDSPATAHMLYAKGDKVIFQITTYNEVTSKTTGEIKYRITAVPINMDLKENILIHYFLTKDEFDIADFTGTFIGTIANIFLSGEGPKHHCVAYVTDVNELIDITTANDLIVTNLHFKDSAFPDKCDDCGKPAVFNELKNWEVEFKYTNVDICICQSCAEKRN